MVDKKGSARDVVLISVVIFALGIALFILYFMMDTTVDNMLNVTAINSSAPTVEVLNSFTPTFDRFDYIVFGVFVGLLFSLLITSWFIGGNPVFMFVYFIVIVVSISVSVILANTWDSIISTGIFGATTIDAFPLTKHLLENLPYYNAIVGMLGLITMFAKPYIEERFGI